MIYFQGLLRITGGRGGVPCVKTSTDRWSWEQVPFIEIVRNSRGWGHLLKSVQTVWMGAGVIF